MDGWRSRRSAGGPMAKNRRIKRKTTDSSSSRAADAPKRDRGPLWRLSGGGREVLGILCLGTAIFLVAAVLSLQFGSGLLMGPFGRSVARLTYGVAGTASYFAAIGLGCLAVRLLSDREVVARRAELGAMAIGSLSIITLLHIVGGDYHVAGYAAGGVVGEYVAEILRAVISTAGTVLVALTGLTIAVVIATPLRIRQVAAVLRRGGRVAGSYAARAARRTGEFCSEVIRAILPERDRDSYFDEPSVEESGEFDAMDDEAAEAHIADPPIIDTRPGASVPAAPMAGDTEKVDDIQVDDSGVATEAEVVEKPKKPAKRKSKKATKKKSVAPVIIPDIARDAVTESETEPEIVKPRFTPVRVADMEEKEKQVDAERLDFIKLGSEPYKLPPITLLDFDESGQVTIDKSAMLELSAKLTQTLENYGVKGEVVAIRPGPVVTMYEFAPAPGTRINKIVSLTDDLAMALEALRVRIVAPIPGKAAVGIEVPNRVRETVYFKEIIADDEFRESKYKLPLALGKDIEGAPVVVDLAKMPHLLVAGTTGSGKSVSVNSMIGSILYHATPEQVRIIMVDPKMLELSLYEGIPHLLLPVVTDPKKANLALRWAVEEMERRYDCLASQGVRDLHSYNRKADKLKAKYEADRLRVAAEEAERLAEQTEDDEPLEVTQEHPPDHGLTAPPERMPYIVVVIDEFADLMMCAPKEVETSVARIAQKARAAGIHLILATQRPSVDVITGLIKANFPSRAAFHVTSKVDSRTILDQGGAEALLGAGDMLFSDRGASPRRLHGCYVDEEELHRVVDFLKEQGRPVYDLDILKPREPEDGAPGTDKEPVDDMYDRAVAIVAETRHVSISMIQRRLRVGYNRAARMVEHMEREGVVSPPDNTNKREVLVAAA